MIPKELLESFTNEQKLLVIEILKERDKQWIEQLAVAHPESWQISDYEKSVKMFDEIAEKFK
jgi:hypothetical protein